MSYSFGYGSSGTNNGNFAAINDNIHAGWNQQFTYDQLNRLYQASNPGAQTGTDWTQTFTYDPWGNLLAKSQSGSIAGTNPNTTQSGNRLAALSYDAAGRVTGDGANSYTYDAEGRILTADGSTYTYDGNGYRVETSGSATTLYWPGLTGQVIDESNASASTMAEQVYFGSQLVWRESAAGSPGLFLFGDHLGSTRLTATAAGLVKDSVSYYPFGDRIPYSSTSSDNHYGFTGLQDDGDSTYATFRNLNRNWGRWLRPDPYDGSYDFTNPQSLNKYSHVVSNPLNFMDQLVFTWKLFAKNIQIMSMERTRKAGLNVSISILATARGEPPA